MSEDAPVTPPEALAPSGRTVQPSPPPLYASIGDRFIGVAVDALVAFGLFFLIGMLIAPRFGGTTATGFELTGAPALLVIVPVILLVLAYHVVLEWWPGATLGKLAAGTQVQTTEGRRVSLRAALLRNLMRLIDGIGVYLVAAIAVMLTRRNQRLGDLVADTVVVRRERARAVQVGGLVAALAVAVGGAVGGFALRGPAPEAGPPRYATLLLTDDPASRLAKTEFSPNTPRIFVVFTLADVPENTLLKSVWIAENVAGVAANTRIDEAELRGGGARNEGSFTFSRPPAGWPPGSYRVELYLGDQLAQSLRFAVPAAPSPIPGASPRPRAPAGQSPSPRQATPTGR